MVQFWKRVWVHSSRRRRQRFICPSFRNSVRWAVCVFVRWTSCRVWSWWRQKGALCG